MKNLLPTVITAFCLGNADAIPGNSDSLRFLAPPEAEIFPDGAVEWKAILSCPDPALASGARIGFALDENLDGRPDHAPDSLFLNPADCENGEARLTRTFFPGRPAVLIAELIQPDRFPIPSHVLAGSLGSLLALKRFCARPKDGETEWVEIRNAAAAPICLDRIRLQGHRLGSDCLEPGAGLVLGPDSAALARWVPGLPGRSVASWPWLRNDGDTLRLETENGPALDSAFWTAKAAESREACASGSHPGAPASGFDVRVVSNPGAADAGMLWIEVETGSTEPYDAVIYDLDGRPLQTLGRNVSGPQRLGWRASECPRLAGRPGPVLLQLRPRRGAAQRKLLIPPKP